MERCPWADGNELYERYHDTEWGVPVHDDRIHFEFLVLEGAQAGLSWLTILRKREAYRVQYRGFDPAEVAAFGDDRIGEMLADAGIVRNRRKITSSIANAKRFLEIQQEHGSFDAYIWRFVNRRPLVNGWEKVEHVPASTNLSDEISKDLKGRGFSFVGSTIIYAHLQAVGIVNDHIKRCFRYRDLLGGG